MKQILFTLIAILSCVSALANGIDNGYRIDLWKYEATVRADNSWRVKETMNVTFLEKRHGIYRYIPRDFAMHHVANGSEALYNYHTVIDSVTVDGYKFTTTDNDDSQDNLIIRIGDEDVLVNGAHTYVISYVLHYPDDRYGGGDVLSHNVLGTDCNTSIGDFVFAIRFEKPLPEGLAMHALSGEWGSTGNALGVNVNVSGNIVSGHCHSIEPYNGISLHAELPEGYWEGAPKESPLAAYAWLAIAAVCFISCMGYLIFHRRERPLTVIEYNAPDGISSAEVGVIIDDSADMSDLTSLIVWWASKGYLRIREIKGKKGLFGKNNSDIELVCIKPLPDDAPDYQKKFWKVLFKKDDTQSVILSKLGDRHKQMSDAMLSLSRYFKGERKLTSLHLMSFLSAVLYIIAGVGFITCSSSVKSLSGELYLYGAFIWAFFILLACLLRYAASIYDMIKPFYWRLLQCVAIIVAGAVDAAIFYFCFYNAPDVLVPLEMLLGVVGGGWVIALFSGRMQRDSKYRLEKMSLLLGFREFIEKSELPMLKAQVDENPSYFYDVLPYAMVFGLTKKWEKQFKGIEMAPPSWFESTALNPGMTGALLSNHISHTISHLISNSIKESSYDTTSTHSSGSGGGGVSFTGGGGGGGGVGSW